MDSPKPSYTPADIAMPVSSQYSEHPPRITVILVTWNSADFLNQALDSLSVQGMPLEIIVVDHGSSDRSIEIARTYEQVRVIETGKNLGFCAGNNLGIHQARGEYILLLNPDARLDAGYLQKAIHVMDANPQAALFTGKILRMDSNGVPCLKNDQAVIDTTGIQLKLNRQAIDRGQGECDAGQYNTAGPIFGVCGAVFFARKSALDAASVDGEYFDEAFFAYKEDVDLSWRLQLLGYQALYDPAASAYHARGWKQQGRAAVSPATRYHSFRNRRLMILKNETIKTLLGSFFPILFFEIGALGYALLREPFLLTAYKETRQLLPRIRHWRTIIHKND